MQEKVTLKTIFLSFGFSLTYNKRGTDKPPPFIYIEPPSCLATIFIYVYTFVSTLFEAGNHSC